MPRWEESDSRLGRSPEMLPPALGSRDPSEVRWLCREDSGVCGDWRPGKGTMVGTHVGEP